MTNPVDQLQVGLWVTAALGRLAQQGLLETAAPAGDELAHASQRLLVETGWLDPDPLGPSPRLRALLPPGAPLSSIAGFVDEQLSMALRYARGAPAGWSEEDPQLIRWRSAGSGPLVGRLFSMVFDGLPGFPERLGRPGAAFLDVGVGGGGICIGLCRTYPDLQAVGIDISKAMLAVAAEDVAREGLADRIQLRETSVVDITDSSAFDLVWLPQPFLPQPVLEQALPPLRRAVRPGGAVVMPINTNTDSGPVGAITDLRNVMTGGGTTTASTSERMLAAAGFAEVRVLDLPGGTVLCATVT
jgi:2-polyprenyl-3-methyl-5-hydroxy-6-metoxy-1,4-benzoquinol methylase